MSTPICILPNMITKDEAEQLPSTTWHVAHALIMARTAEKVTGGYDAQAWILMILRHDGRLGFPGGGIDSGETWEQGINRELREEIGVSEDLLKITDADHYVASARPPDRDMCGHFYMAEVTEKTFKKIEKGALEAEHYGHEVLGTMRVPLWVNHRGDGLPRFMEHKFAGNSLYQLQAAIKRLNITVDMQSETEK